MLLDIMLNFERTSYGVHDKNKAEAPVIRITYPIGYIPRKMFPIVAEVIVTNISANGKSLHSYLSC